MRRIFQVVGLHPLRCCAGVRDNSVLARGLEEHARGDCLRRIMIVELQCLSVAILPIDWQAPAKGIQATSSVLEEAPTIWDSAGRWSRSAQHSTTTENRYATATSDGKASRWIESPACACACQTAAASASGWCAATARLRRGGVMSTGNGQSIRPGARGAVRPANVGSAADGLQSVGSLSA